MNNYRELIRTVGGEALELNVDASGIVLCPSLGGRVFAEVCGESVHRIDLQNVASPNRSFNNFGGGNLWPAPEGGKFGFNYRDNEWYVQDGINSLPFNVVSQDPHSLRIEKCTTLVNRAGTVVDTLVSRHLSISALPSFLGGYSIRGSIAYTATDHFRVINSVDVERALISAWTLEQFDATDNTVSFCRVQRPEEAINFDYYVHPAERIVCSQTGFTYKTDGLCRGQIGIKANSKPDFVGFFDLSKNLLCLRTNESDASGLFFNIADNEQAQGPYSAADSYSIFNSDDDAGFFELETIGAADVADGILRGSKLISRTTFVIFEDASDIRAFVADYIGASAVQ